MQIIETPCAGLLEVRLETHGDGRGYFVEAYRESWRESLGCARPFVQDNHSYSRPSGVLRGLHFQRPPRAQAKLVRVMAGSIFDVVVDLRQGSTTFGRHHTLTLSAEVQNQLFIPEGFAHGFLTLEPDTHVCYKLTEYYHPEAEGGVRWNDPELGIDWPGVPAVIAERDAGWGGVGGVAGLVVP
jgi:dTDP-4-dehydrorhamnose 3,5-epimerase